MKLNPLVHSIIWPAVAGNILWAFIQVAVDPNIADPSKIPGDSYFFRLAALFFVGAYLAIDWYYTNIEIEKNNMNESYWKWDLFLAAALATFAICTQSGTPLGALWSNYALAFAFLVAMVGHCKGAWDTLDKKTSNPARACFAITNAIGFILLIIGICKPSWSLWLTPLAIFLVVVLFVGSRKKVLSLWP